jgi:hypothetical protein
MSANTSASLATNAKINRRGRGEAGLLSDYLARGGRLLVMIDPTFPLGPELGGLLRKVGLTSDQAVVIDPLNHYGSEDDKVAARGPLAGRAREQRHGSSWFLSETPISRQIPTSPTYRTVNSQSAWCAGSPMTRQGPLRSRDPSPLSRSSSPGIRCVTSSSWSSLPCR